MSYFNVGSHLSCRSFESHHLYRGTTLAKDVIFISEVSTVSISALCTRRSVQTAVKHLRVNGTLVLQIQKLAKKSHF